MRSRSRNEQEKFERRETLLNAAQAVFSKQGFERTSMDDIASEAGFSRGLLYVYFKDKKDIYRSLRVRGVEALLERMSRHMDPAASGITQIKQSGEAFYDFYRHEKKLFNCMSLDISLNNQDSSLKREANEHPEAMAVEQQIMQLMEGAIRAGMADGSVDPKKVDSPLQAAMILRGCLHGVILLQDQDGSAMLDRTNIDKHKLVLTALNQITNSLKPG